LECSSCAANIIHVPIQAVAALPLLEILSGIHIQSDLTLSFGSLIPDYLAT